MSDVNTETQGSKSFNAEAFAMNIAKAMETSGQALAAYLKPREGGEPKDKPPSEIGEVIKTFTKVAEYWMTDKERAEDIQTRMGKAYLDLWGQAARRMAGEAGAKPAIEPSPRDKRFKDPEWKSNQFFDFVLQLYLLTTQWAQELVKNADGVDPHTRKKAEFYVQQIANAIAPSNFVLTNPEVLRETLASNGDNLVRGMKMLNEDIEAGRGTLRIRQSDPANLVVGVNMATTPGQGDLPERADAAHPVHADHRDGAAHAAADRAALDQQVLHSRSQAGKILHQMVRRPGHHRVRDLLGQSRQGARQEDLRRLHEARPAHRDGRHRKGDGRDEGPHRRLLRRRHPARLDAGAGSPRSGASASTSATFFAAQVDFTHAGDLLVFVDEDQISTLEARDGRQGRISKAARWRWPSTCCAPTI